MKILALVHHIDIMVRMEILFPLHNGSQIGGGVKSGSVGLSDDTRRQFLGIRFLCNVHHQGSLALIRQSLFHKPIDHGGDIRLGIALTFPQIKLHIQIGVIFL